MKPLAYLLAGILIGIALMLGFSGAEELPPGPHNDFREDATAAVWWDCSVVVGECHGRTEQDIANSTVDALLHYDQLPHDHAGKVYIRWASACDRLCRAAHEPRWSDYDQVWLDATGWCESRNRWTIDAAHDGEHQWTRRTFDWIASERYPSAVGAYIPGTPRTLQRLLALHLRDHPEGGRGHWPGCGWAA